MGRGSLGEVLPQSLKDLLGTAGNPGPLMWAGEHQTHRLFAPTPSSTPRLFTPDRRVVERADDFAPLS